ncbi:hypothetical protein LguiB_020923 [Lonicera macranthoides]
MGSACRYGKLAGPGALGLKSPKPPGGQQVVGCLVPEDMISFIFGLLTTYEFTNLDDNDLSTLSLKTFTTSDCFQFTFSGISLLLCMYRSLDSNLALMLLSRTHGGAGLFIPDRLEGDQEEVTFTDAQGVLRCSPHHDDWEDLDWYDEDGVDRGRAVIYRDITRAAPVPDVPWLLMEPASHEIRRRSLIFPRIRFPRLDTSNYHQIALFYRILVKVHKGRVMLTRRRVRDRNRRL